MTILRLFPAESSLPASAATEVAWRTQTGSQIGHGRSALSQLPAASRVELFLPPARVLRATVTLPKGAGRQAGKLLPFALDQVLLSEPAEQHLAHQLAGEQCRVAAVQREFFAELLNTLTQVGRRPRAAWAADVLVPGDGGMLLWYGNGWARRSQETAQWFDAASPTEPPALLVAALGELESLSLAIEPALAEQVDLARWQLRLGCPVSLYAGDIFAATVESDAINLMQGEFAAGAQIDVDWPRLKPAGVLAGSALALCLVTLLGQWWSWRSEEGALKQSINGAFSQAFPNTPIVDAQLQLQTMLSSKATAAPTSSGALTALLNTAPRLMAGEIKLLALEYADGRFQAEYLAKPEQLAALVQTLSQNGKVETSPSGNDRTRLSLTPNP
ncbi:type II secretion system protein GspL [Chitinimonas arctica]|uniref:type II secretion system protein GspL n=1 Tax=Chitinimonas arctica TaxID=2594795 RepID=UPI0015D28DBF|nr:type II secretion system protein GspL [Chitinimonas arctica]